MCGAVISSSFERHDDFLGRCRGSNERLRFGFPEHERRRLPQVSDQEAVGVRRRSKAPG